MNRNITMLLVSVILLGMILLVLNQWAIGPAKQMANKSSDNVDYSVLNKKTEKPFKPSGGGVRMSVDSSATPPQLEKPADAQPAPVAEETPKVEAKAAKDPVTAIAKMAEAQKEVSAPSSAPAVKEDGSGKVKSEAKQVETSVAKAIEPAKPKVAPVKVVKQEPRQAVNTMMFTADNTAGTLRVRVDSKVKYKVFPLRKPARLVLDLLGRTQIPTLPKVAKNGFVKSVRAGKHKDRVRIVLDLVAEHPGEFDAEQPAADEVVLIVR